MNAMTQKYKVFDRNEAGKLLSIKLRTYEETDAVVIGIPKGGVIVAAKIAEQLHLPLGVVPCRTIKDPTNASKSIGSVTCNEVVVQGNCSDIPQDYISHQIALLQTCLQSEWKNYFSNNIQIPLRYKTVIIVDDILTSYNSIVACVMSVVKQMPLKIVVAVPFISAEAERKLVDVVDEVFFIQLRYEVRSGKDCYLEYPVIDEREVKNVLQSFKINV